MPGACSGLYDPGYLFEKGTQEYSLEIEAMHVFLIPGKQYSLIVD